VRAHITRSRHLQQGVRSGREVGTQCIAERGHARNPIAGATGPSRGNSTPERPFHYAEPLLSMQQCATYEAGAPARLAAHAAVRYRQAASYPAGLLQDCRRTQQHAVGHHAWRQRLMRRARTQAQKTQGPTRAPPQTSCRPLPGRAPAAAWRSPPASAPQSKPSAWQRRSCAPWSRRP
jgi:hypothetical protein